MSNHCKVCGNDHDNRFHTIREMMFGTKHSFEYLECSKCGTIQIIDPPEDMGFYYPDDYYAYIPLNESNWTRKMLKKIRWELYKYLDIKPFRPLYGDWLKKTGAQKEDRIADVGCGNGQLLYEMYASGFKNLVGIDPFIEADRVVNSSLSLLKRSIFEMEDNFDLIMMHHSFEHMDEPKEVLEKANQLLKPGKNLLIRIPISGGEAWKTYGVHWAQLDAPRHIFIHSIKSIRLLAEQTGFEVSQIIYDSEAYQFWASEAIRKGVPSTEAQGMFTKEEIKDFAKRAKKLNREGGQTRPVFTLSRNSQISGS